MEEQIPTKEEAEAAFALLQLGENKGREEVFNFKFESAARRSSSNTSRQNLVVGGNKVNAWENNLLWKNLGKMMEELKNEREAKDEALATLDLQKKKTQEALVDLQAEKKAKEDAIASFEHISLRYRELSQRYAKEHLDKQVHITAEQTLKEEYQDLLEKKQGLEERMDIMSSSSRDARRKFTKEKEDMQNKLNEQTEELQMVKDKLHAITHENSELKKEKKIHEEACEELKAKLEDKTEESHKMKATLEMINQLSLSSPIASESKKD